MKNTLLGLALAFLLIPCLVLAASDSEPLLKAQGTVPTQETKSSYNDGWVDVFPVPMDQNGEFRDLRGRSTLDVFDSTHYFEDFEGDCTAWTPEDLTVDAAPTAYWHIDDTLAIGGAAWYCADTTLNLGAPYGGGYEDHKLMYLISDTLDLTSAATPVNLAFKARWSMEDPDTNTADGCLYNLWDSWNVWASTDNGATWAVIQPTAPAYTNTSSFSFGYEWEMGCNIPAWGGTQADFVECTFNLNSLVGNSQVLIRWAFASDPGYNSADDPTMFGVVVDSIRVTDASRAVLLSNDGDADEFVSRFDTLARSGLTWFYDNSTSHSPSYCWTATVDTSLLQDIESAPFVLPTGYDLLRLRYWVWCNMLDDDGDGDGFIDDYFDFWITDVDSGTPARRIGYDYGYDDGADDPGGDSKAGWVLRRQALTTGGTLIDISVRPWAGRTVKLMVRQRTDENDDGGVGTGLHIDDLEIWGTRAYQIDMEMRDITFNFPTTLGLSQQYSYVMANAGINTLGNNMRHRLRFYKPNATSVDSVITPSPGFMLDIGQDTTFIRNWNPSLTGCWRNYAIATYTGDQDRTNDTSRTPVMVPVNPDSNLAVYVRAADEYELAYHPRLMQNGYVNPRYVYYTPVADRVPADTAAAFDIKSVRIMWQYDEDMAGNSSTSWIEFWSDSLPDHPGHLLKRFEVEIDTSESIGAAGRPHWWNMDVSCTELSNLSGNFWVSVTAQDSVNGSQSPNIMGYSMDPVVYDGHHFVIRLDSTSAFMPSPGRYLIQTLIKATRMPGQVDDVVARRDGMTNDIILNWSAVPRATGYKVYRLTNASHHYSQGTLLTPVPVATNTYTDSGILLNATAKFFYQVIAVN